MRILLSNDDGYLAPGLACLANALRPLAQLDVVAPERDRSGASNSLTLDRPLRIKQGENGFLYVDGTPTDCVHLAITGLMEHEPDMVIAGINRGANLGDDVLYSGTVAAAMEGRFLGAPAIAVSLVGQLGQNFQTAADIVVRLVQRLGHDPLPGGTIPRVHLPGPPPPPGAPGAEPDPGPGTDFYAIRRQCVSITPLHVDLTRYTALDQVTSWLKKL